MQNRRGAARGGGLSNIQDAIAESLDVVNDLIRGQDLREVEVAA
jgi:hypothetical protein